MYRRTFLKALAQQVAVTGLNVRTREDGGIGVIDSHIHLFDPRRKQGVPWPDKSDAVLYQPALPQRYDKIARPHGVVGAIAIECSPWVDDNDWLAEVVERSPMMLGFVGNLLPESRGFPAQLDRLHRSPQFLGIRYGNLWGRDLRAAADKPAFIDGLKALSMHDLVLETANQDAALIEAALKVSDRVPGLRIVLDHLPKVALPEQKSARAAVETNLRELAQRQRIAVKGSEIVHRVAGCVPLDASAYRDSLDRIWDLFTEDRILYGSDWPNSDTVAQYAQVFSVAQDYLRERPMSAQKKYFRTNSRAIYRWKPRTPEQAESLQKGH